MKNEGKEANKQDVSFPIFQPLGLPFGSFNHTYLHIYITYTHTRALTHARTHALTHSRTHTHTHTHTHTACTHTPTPCTHTHTQVPPQMCQVIIVDSAEKSHSTTVVINWLSNQKIKRQTYAKELLV